MSDSPRPQSSASSKAPMSFSGKSNSTSEGHLKAPATNHITSPQDPLAPSPVTSDVTQFDDTDTEASGTEEEDEGTEKASQAEPQSDIEPSDVESKPRVTSPRREDGQRIATPLRLETGPELEQQFKARLDEEKEPQSVIHIPTGFGKFPPTPSQATSGQQLGSTRESSNDDKPEQLTESEWSRADSAESRASNATVTGQPVSHPVSNSKPSPRNRTHENPMPPTPLQTSLPSFLTNDWSRTPRAQTRHDFAFGAISRPGSSLASIMEGEDTDHPSSADETGDEVADVRQRFLHNVEAEIEALRNALSECWTLCNTLASLSHIHRERIFNFSGRGDMQEQAWKSCWRLCQNLYNTRDDDPNSIFSHNSSRPTLDLCRDFCQSLFEVRVRDNETADSVLRVSFELNNHLFNTHDRSLPEAFRERTLDFYITLCHRLMKQKSKMAEETDSLLRACWSLAEMLFSLRQNRREGKRPDEELLGSAIQACWELCDLFREGWTQIRPERGTPRPSQTTFTQAFNQAKRSGFAPLDNDGNPRHLPETPTTIFEDTVNTISPDEAPIPNILVLAAEEAERMSVASVTSAPAPIQRSLTPNTGAARNSHSAHPGLPNSAINPRWSSTSSVLSVPASAMSGMSPGGMNPTSATTVSTIRTPAEDPTLTLLKVLFVKAAMSVGRGFSRQSPDPNLHSLPTFVKNLPDNAFGNQAWQITLLENYRKSIVNDSGFRNLGVAGTVAERGRISPVDIARAVQGMTSCVYGFGWLRDLYRHVFGYYVEEALKGSDALANKRGSHAGRQTGPAASLAAAVLSINAAASAVGGNGTAAAGGGGAGGNGMGNGSGNGNGNGGSRSSSANGHSRRTVSQ